LFFLAWDKLIFSFFHHWSGYRIPALVFGFLTFLGDGWFALLVTVALWIWEKHRLKAPARTARALFWTCLSSGILAQIVKYLVRRPRPLGPSPTSFPSGHAATAFTMAVILTRRWPRWGWLFWSLAVLVGISRMVLGWHYPLDVMAGACLGMATAWVYLRRFHQRKKEGPSPPK